MTVPIMLLEDGRVRRRRVEDRTRCSEQMDAFLRHQVDLQHAWKSYLSSIDSLRILWLRQTPLNSDQEQEQQSPPNIRQISSRSSDRARILQEDFRESCAAARGSFTRSTTAVLDCPTSTTTTNNNVSTTEIIVLQDVATCIPPTIQSENGDDNDPWCAWEWQTNMFMFEEDSSNILCHVRPNTSYQQYIPMQDLLSLPPSKTNHSSQLPEGTPIFSRSKTNTQQQETNYRHCQAWMESTWTQHPSLKQAHDEATIQNRHIETLQWEPILIQREWYDDNDVGGGDDGHNNNSTTTVTTTTTPTTYEQECQSMGGHMVSYSGILDCIDLESRFQSTTMIESRVQCFPAAAACADYYSNDSLQPWIVDTMRYEEHRSCNTLRSSSMTPSSNSLRGGTTILVLVVVVTGLLVVLLVVRYWIRNRQRHSWRWRSRVIAQAEEDCDGVFQSHNHNNDNDNIRR